MRLVGRVRRVGGVGRVRLMRLVGRVRRVGGVGRVRRVRRVGWADPSPRIFLIRHTMPTCHAKSTECRAGVAIGAHLCYNLPP